MNPIKPFFPAALALLLGIPVHSIAMESAKSLEQCTEAPIKKGIHITELPGVSQDVSIAGNTRTVILPYPLFPWNTTWKQDVHFFFANQGSYITFTLDAVQAVVFPTLLPCIGGIAYNPATGVLASFHQSTSHNPDSLRENLAKDFPNSEAVVIKLYSRLDEARWITEGFASHAGKAKQIAEAVSIVKTLRDAGFPNVTLETYPNPNERNNYIGRYMETASSCIVFSCEKPLNSAGEIVFSSIEPASQDILSLRSMEVEKILDTYADALENATGIKNLFEDCVRSGKKTMQAFVEADKDKELLEKLLTQKLLPDLYSDIFMKINDFKLKASPSHTVEERDSKAMEGLMFRLIGQVIGSKSNRFQPYQLPLDRMHYAKNPTQGDGSAKN